VKNQQVRKFREVLRAFERELLFQVNANACGVTIAQCHALMEVEKSRQTKVGDLAKTMSLDKSTISRTVDGLVRIGLVKRTIPEENRRTTYIHLTNRGTEVCNSINDENDFYFNDLLNSLTEGELNPFLKGFEKVTNKMRMLNNKIKDNE